MKILKKLLKDWFYRNFRIFSVVDDFERRMLLAEKSIERLEIASPGAAILFDARGESVWGGVLNPSNIKYISSYAGQDYFVMQFFNGKRNGVCLEIGGYDGLTASNTFFLEKGFGWKCILVEGHPDFQKEISKNRPDAKLLPYCVSDKEEEVSFLTGGGSASGIAEYHKDLDSYTQVYTQVKTRPFSRIFKEEGITHLDFMSLDVEGAELTVLRSIDFSQVSITLICIESNGRQQFEENYRYLSSLGYEMITPGCLGLFSGGRDTFFTHKNYVTRYGGQTYNLNDPGVLIPD